MQKSNGSKLIAKGVLDGVSIPPSPPNAHHLCNNVRGGYLTGMTGFDRASNNLRATSEATDLISAKLVNANDDVYNMALAA